MLRRNAARKRIGKPFELPDGWIQPVPYEKLCANDCTQQSELIYSTERKQYIRSKYCYYCRKQKLGLMEPMIGRKLFLR